MSKQTFLFMLAALLMAVTGARAQSSLCYKPTNLELKDHTTTTATLCWTENGSATSWVIEYGTSSDFGDATSVAVDVNPHTLTGLTAEQTYYARVKAVCGGDDQSAWSNACEFKPTAVQIVTIGDGTSADYYLPVNTYYNYSLTQQIYTAEEIGAAGGSKGSISSISFYNDYNGTIKIKGIQVYLLNTDKAAFSDDTDMVSVTVSDKVWEGNITLNGAGWVKIDLATPFNYEGRNLIVCMYDPIRGYPGERYIFRYTETTDYTSVYYYDDNLTPDLNNINSFNGKKSFKRYHNNIQLGITTTTPKPRSLEVSNLNAWLATVSWTAPAENVQAYHYQYGPTGGTMSDWLITNETSVNLTGLTPETAYTFNVYAEYADGNSDPASKAFTTDPTCHVPTGLSQTHTNHSATLSWTPGSEGQNAWQIAYSTTVFDPNAAEFDLTTVTMIDNVSETTYTFDKTLAPNTHYYMYVRSNCGEGDYSKWTGIDFTTVVSAPTPTITTVGEFTPVSAVLQWTAPAGDFLASYDIYYSQTIGEPADESDIQYKGIDAIQTSCRLDNLTKGDWFVYIRAYHGETDGYSSWGAAQFNFPGACPIPTGLTTGNPTPISISLNWKAGAEWQTAWTVAYSTVENFDPDDNDVATRVDADGPVDENGNVGPFEVKGLAPETTYYFRVKGNCGDEYGQSEWTNAVSGTTLVTCLVPSNLNVTVNSNSATLEWTGYSDSYTVQYRTTGEHYEMTEGFEGGSLPDGWIIKGDYTWRVGVGDYSTDTGTHSGNYNALIVTNSYDSETFLITPALDFSGVSEASIDLWYINRSWGSDTDGFGVYYRGDDGAWECLSSTDEGHSSWTSQTLYLPDLTGICQIGFKCDGRNGYGVGLDDITISYDTHGEWTTIENIEDETVAIKGLGYGTKYDVRVKANCGAEKYCDIVTFTTPDAPADITLSETADNASWIEANDDVEWNVTLGRTLQTGGWNTFSVPFATPIPDGWTVKELTGSSLSGTTLTLNFGDATGGIEAGRPYLVKVGDASVVNPAFSGVTIADGTTEAATDYADFVPVISPASLTGGDKSVLFVTGGNTLTYPAADGIINGFRAYFRLHDPSGARTFRMSFGDEDTGITTTRSDQVGRAGDTYTLDGRRIDGMPAKKGVYIVNGKKKVIK